jgi:hypothetical protein
VILVDLVGLGIFNVRFIAVLAGQQVYIPHKMRPETGKLVTVFTLETFL